MANKIDLAGKNAVVTGGAQGIGRAIVEYAKEHRVPTGEPAHFSYVPGQGVSAVYGGENILVGNSGFVTSGRLPAGSCAQRSVSARAGISLIARAPAGARSGGR